MQDDEIHVDTDNNDMIVAFLELEPEFDATIIYEEGMALYNQIKQRHDDLFRELA